MSKSQFNKEYYPPVARAALNKLTPEQRDLFHHEYSSRRRGKAAMVLLAIFFPIQLFLLDKMGLGLAFLFTVGGGGIWWFIEIFLTGGRVTKYNGEVAMNILRDIRITQ